MKTTLFAFILFCVAFFVNAQETSKYSTSKHELSIVVDDIFAKNDVNFVPLTYYTSSLYSPSYIYYPTLELNTPKIGLGYKYHFSNLAIRSKVSFATGNEDSDKTSGTVNVSKEKTETEYLTASINLGFELNKNIDKISVFYGIDIFVGVIKSKSKYTRGSYEYPYNEYVYPSYVTENKESAKSIGLSPLAGVKYFITPALSISTEMKFIVEFEDGKSTVKRDNVEQSKNTVSGMDTQIGPLGQISVNIHF